MHFEMQQHQRQRGREYYQEQGEASHPSRQCSYAGQLLGPEIEWSTIQEAWRLYSTVPSAILLQLCRTVLVRRTSFPVVLYDNINLQFFESERYYIVFNDGIPRSYST